MKFNNNNTTAVLASSTAAIMSYNGFGLGAITLTVLGIGIGGFVAGKLFASKKSTVTTVVYNADGTVKEEWTEKF